MMLDRLDLPDFREKRSWMTDVEYGVEGLSTELIVANKWPVLMHTFQDFNSICNILVGFCPCNSLVQ